MTPTSWCELLGLDRVEVLDVVRLLNRLFVTVESTDLAPRDLVVHN